MDVTRRSLLTKGALATGAVAAGAVAMAGSALADEAVDAPAQAPAGSWDYTTDILIVGEGMGGLCAAAQAQADGAQNVMIVEASKWVGGGSSFCNGSIHAGSAGTNAQTLASFTESLSNKPMSIAVIEQIPDLQLWLRDDLQLPLMIEEGEISAHEAVSTFDDSAPRGHMITEDGIPGIQGCVNFFNSFEAMFLDRGGTVLHNVSARHIVQDEDGNIVGVRCYDTQTGATVKIAASQVILACGGWQNDTEMKQRYLGPDGRYAGLMGVPYNTGSGIKMAQEVGASLQGDFGHFAGLFLAAYPAKNWMEDPQEWETYGYDEEEGGKWWIWHTILDSYPDEAILVNNDGLRFCDEDAPGHSTENAIARQSQATAIVIADSTAWENWLELGGRGTSAVYMRDKIDAITSEQVGGVLYTADTLEDLADQMNASGIASHRVNKGNLVRTVEEYNAAAEAGTGDQLPVARITSPCEPIVTPPFYALPITNGIFMTFGGIAVNDSCQVLDGNRMPIAGLYAVSPCAGGFMEEFYCGSVAHAGVTGRWAGSAAAAAIGASAAAAPEEPAEDAASAEDAAE